MDTFINILGCSRLLLSSTAGVWHDNHTVSLAQSPKIPHTDVAPIEVD
jgi:hypothetical protein